MVVGLTRRITSFLYFGYLPQITEDFMTEIWVDKVDPLHSVGGAPDESQLIAQGIRSHKSAFEDLIGDMHIVPLSGGIDSRSILGALIDAGLKDQIAAVTLGTPGTWDYEIGSYVAMQAGICHETIDLTQVPLKQELLERVVNEGGSWTMLFDAFYQRLIPSSLAKTPFTGAVFWGTRWLERIFRLKRVKRGRRPKSTS